MKKSGKKVDTKGTSKFSNKRFQEAVCGYIFIAPVVIGLGIFYIYPFFQNFYNSFTDINNFNKAKWIGLGNYKELLSDPAIWQALGNTLKYVVITVPIGITLSLIIASLLNTDIKGKSIYRTIYFLPSVTMSAAISMVWKWIYNGQFGLLNGFLQLFGAERRNWLSDPKLTFYMIMIVGIWCGVGYNMIILLAGMQGISKSYYEAAEIDGASSIKKFFLITLPLLTPTIFFVVVTAVIGGFQVFDTIYMMIGKANIAFESTQTLVMIFYRNAFDYSRKGYASAISIFIFLIIMIITIIQLKLQKKWVNYDD